MTDPFSAAGGAVGVISLGLTVCQGFLAYYGPYKSFHEEINIVTTRMEALKCILKVVQNLISEINMLNVPSIAQSIQVANDTILFCQDVLLKLHGILNKCYASVPSGRLAASELKAQVKRVLYPFQRQTLMSLVENVSWLQDNLNTSLQMMQISLAIVGQNQMHTILTKSAAMVSNTGHMAGALQQMDHKSETLDHSLVRLERRLDKMKSHLVASGTQLISNPGFFQSLLDTQQNLDTDLKAAYNESKDALSHEKSCPFHKSGKRIVSLVVKRTICNRLIRFSMLASLHVTVGAGGLAVSPKLEFRPVVPKDSPAFTLLRDVEARLKSDHNRSVIQDTNKRLFELFREGKASPLDTLPDGNTILHYVTHWQAYACRWDARLWDDWRRFINGLLDAGLSPSCVDYMGTTPADKMIELYETYHNGHEGPARESATLAICSDILRAGGHMTCNALDWRYHSNHINPVYHMDVPHLFEDHTVRLVWLLEDSKELQDINLPDELVPLIDRSKDQLLSLLTQGLDMQPWISSYTQWPTGLSILLQAGCDPIWDSFRRACEADCKAGVQILINNRKFQLGPDELRVASIHHNQEIVQLTIQALVDRRKRLQDLAVACLPSEVLAQLQIRSDCLLNMEAAKVYKLLRLHSIEVDDIEEEYGWSVYDAVGCNLSVADQLWHAGFRDVDEVDNCGKTSLMRLGYSNSFKYGPVPLLKKAHWLITKGSSAHRKKSSSPALHFLGHAIGDAISSLKDDKDVRSKLSRLDEDCRKLLWSIFYDDTRDSCDCACSVGGCCGLTRALDELFPRRHWVSTESSVRRVSATIEFIASSLEPKLRGQFYDQIAPGVLRFLSCRMLEITHTCSHDWRNIDPEEVDEIHDEERYLICALENFLNEITAEYEESIETLPEFLTGAWWIRIKEAISMRDTPTEWELNQLLQTGIVLKV
ncbi:hypothetical protein BDW42DRAFT_201995 [Aspergillus taichungensis]|uniref:Fungal N-terminal domain-containing protein n=1 Tax=Aspergillus taichungensis TaxID=482145 RepID=A0A2J5HNG5_9EURO|nr:hypothetical protein BDW42DRAFT_201995 [Aspergillus taichungensis]